MSRTNIAFFIGSETSLELCCNTNDCGIRSRALVRPWFLASMEHQKLVPQKPVAAAPGLMPDVGFDIGGAPFFRASPLHFSPPHVAPAGRRHWSRDWQRVEVLGRLREVFFRLQTRR